jgi:HSP20 family molecular chaperone IbpA
VETPEERKAKAIRDIMKEKDDVEGLGDFLEASNVSGCNTAKENQIQGIDASINGKMKQEAGYSWTQTEEELEVVVTLPITDVSAKDIKVDFNSQHVVVTCRTKPLLDMSLFEAIDLESCTWTINAHDQRATLVLAMEKVEQALWSRIEN